METSYENFQFDSLAKIKEFEKIPLMQRLAEKNTYEILKNAAIKHPDKIALTFLAQSEPLNTDKVIQFTYKDLIDQVHRTANLLDELQIKKGDSLSYILPNIPENYFIYLASQALGAIANPINPTFSASQITALFKTAGTKLLITTSKEITPPAIWKNIENAKETAEIKQTLYVGPGGPENNFSILLKNYTNQFQPPNISLDDIAALFHSSNTTGEPKLVKLSHKNLVFMAYLCGIYTKYTIPNSVFLSALPMFHVAAPMLGGLSVFKYGAETIVMGPFGWMDDSMIQNFWKIVERYQATSFTALPFIFNRLLQVPINGAKVNSLRSAISGMSVPEHEVKLFKEWVGIDIDLLWGQTEVTAMGAFNPGSQPGSAQFGKVGFPCPYQETRIVKVDSAGNYLRDCVSGEEGILLVKGPHVGEYKKPELNQTIIPGWHNTGDWVSQDDEGCISFHCRVQDFIYRNKQFVSLLEIEMTLADHDQVQRAAAIGIEDPSTPSSQNPVVYIELKPNATISMENLYQWLSEKLAGKPYLIPIELITHKHLPVNGMGKILKHKLLEEYLQKQKQPFESI